MPEACLEFAWLKVAGAEDAAGVTFLKATEDKLKTQGFEVPALDEAATKRLYQQEGARADEILFAHLPWIPAILGQKVKSPDGKERRRIYLPYTTVKPHLGKFKCLDDSALTGLAVFSQLIKASLVGKLKVGAKVMVRVTPGAPGKVEFRQLKAVDKLEPFWPNEYIVITHVNEKKSVYGYTRFISAHPLRGQGGALSFKEAQ